MIAPRPANDVYPPETPEPLTIIRERTRGLHAQVESAVDIGYHLESRDAYRGLLTRYVRLYRPLERLIGQQPAEVLRLLRWSERPRLSRLVQDLTILGIAPEQLIAMSDCTSLPTLRDLDAVLGALYVVEGSSLGGRYLYREVNMKLGLDQHSGAAFFFGEGDRTAETWSRFVSLLQEKVSSAEHASEAAVAMFAAFQSVLTDPRTSGGSPA